MLFIDTHTHLFLDEFKDDRFSCITKAVDLGIKYMILPNIDSTTVEPLLQTVSEYPHNCFPALGLHPTSVKNNYKEELKIAESWMSKVKFYAIGETGIDLYWDKTFIVEQEKKHLYNRQNIAIHYKLPIIIHSRNSLDELISIIEYHNNPELYGVFHCFPGNTEQAKKVIAYGFKIGIGGVVTYKNSSMQEVVKDTDLQHILLETDSPYLPPVPFRGKRNESSYICYIAEKISQIKQLPIEKVAEFTSANALKLFNLKM